MITVRFPNGQAVTYSDANQITWGESVHAISIGALSDPKVRKVAFVSAGAGCIFEFCKPCKIENPVTALTVEKAITLLTESNLRDLNYRGGVELAALKNKLRSFDARRHTWKESY